MLIMGPVILTESGSARDRRVVVVSAVCREQAILLEQFLSSGHEMEFWERICYNWNFFFFFRNGES